MKRLILACSSLAVSLTLGAHPNLAGAQAAEEPEAYQQAIGEAVAEFSAGRWEEARSLFTEAHRLNPNARTLRGLGMAAFELRNYVESLQMLQAAMESQVNPLTPELRVKTEGLLERARSFVGVYDIEAPEGTTIAVDTQPAAYDSGGKLLLNTGKRRLGIRFADGVEVARIVDVRGGEQGTLVFERPSTSPQPAPPPVPVPVATQPPSTVGQASAGATGQVDEGSSILPLVLVVAGGAMVGTGVVTGLMAKGAEGDLEDACGMMRNACPDTHQDKADTANGLATATNVLWIGGAVLAALGVTLILVEGDDEQPAVQAGVGLASEAAAVNVWGRF
ncbi:MAG: tetratricopeptide repeat protein [Myxococcales bacterium]|nr:tetratricopeptide repeat protein [Myxococcales bacterium]MDD9971961.1 tetratricopeptide repeat protein [Myxococcales bacterium]